jgi:hypothetical protein
VQPKVCTAFCFARKRRKKRRADPSITRLKKSSFFSNFFMAGKYWKYWVCWFVDNFVDKWTKMSVFGQKNGNQTNLAKN